MGPGAGVVFPRAVLVVAAAVVALSVAPAAACFLVLCSRLRWLLLVWGSSPAAACFCRKCLWSGRWVCSGVCPPLLRAVSVGDCSLPRPLAPVPHLLGTPGLVEFPTAQQKNPN